MTLQKSIYKVYKKTFLTSIKWLFSYSTIEDHFVEKFVSEMLELSYTQTIKEAQAVMMKKQGITVLANAELVFINCAAEEYQGFDRLKSELQSILAVLEKLGVKELKNITCVKENIFRIDKDRIKSNLSESFLATTLFNESFASNPIFADSRDGIQFVVTRSFSDSVKESRIQMLVTVSWNVSLSISFAVSKLVDIDRVSYDAWSYVVSDGVKQIMEG